VVDTDTGGDDRHNGLSEGRWTRFREMTFASSASPQPRTADGIELPNPTGFAEAMAWARDHEVTGKDALAWTKDRRPPTSDLRLAPSSLPVVSELLVSGDMEMARTSLIALQLNGAEVESDARWESPSTRFEVKFPDDTERTVEFTS
jgi:hypothetical protein